MLNIFPSGEEYLGQLALAVAWSLWSNIQGSQGKIQCRGQQGLPVPWKDTRLAS